MTASTYRPGHHAYTYRNPLSARLLAELPTDQGLTIDRIWSIIFNRKNVTPDQRRRDYFQIRATIKRMIDVGLMRHSVSYGKETEEVEYSFNIPDNHVLRLDAIMYLMARNSATSRKAS